MQARPSCAAPQVADGEGPHPVVIFSHGLGGHRGMYSIVCSELASQVRSVVLCRAVLCCAVPECCASMLSVTCSCSSDLFCASLLSWAQGYVVLAVEHADGSASACRLAGSKARALRLADLAWRLSAWRAVRFLTGASLSPATQLLCTYSAVLGRLN